MIRTQREWDGIHIVSLDHGKSLFCLPESGTVLDVDSKRIITISEELPLRISETTFPGLETRSFVDQSSSGVEHEVSISGDHKSLLVLTTSSATANLWTLDIGSWRTNRIAEYTDMKISLPRFFPGGVSVLVNRKLTVIRFSDKRK